MVLIFNPVTGQQSFNLLPVWDFHYRSKLPAHQNGGGTRAAICHYREFISEGPSVVAGDFNNNVFWDKVHPGYAGNFSLVKDDLKSLGLESAYHQFENCRYKEEPEPTLYWRMSKTHVYHIDYCFFPNDWFHKRLQVTLGRPERWLHFSDHLPLVVEVEM
jgi:endonuclease/exonuclease/phosphatase family metal-dependent hydrolase